MNAASYLAGRSLLPQRLKGQVPHLDLPLQLLQLIRGSGGTPAAARCCRRLLPHAPELLLQRRHLLLQALALRSQLRDLPLQARHLGAQPGHLGQGRCRTAAALGPEAQWRGMGSRGTPAGEKGVISRADCVPPPPPCSLPLLDRPHEETARNHNPPSPRSSSDRGCSCCLTDAPVVPPPARG